MKTKSSFKYNPNKRSNSIFKDPRTGIFICDITINHRRYKLSSGVRDAASAQNILWQRYCNILKGEHVKRRLDTQSTATLADIYNILSNKIVLYSRQNIKANTFKNYIATLRRIVSVTHKNNPDSLRLSELKPDLLTNYINSRYAALGKSIETPDLSLNYSINSDIVNALSVFSKTALSLYESEKIKIPENVLEFKKFKKLPQKKFDFIPVNPDLDGFMVNLCKLSLGEAVSLPESDKELAPSPVVAIVYELARFCGLTSKEIRNAQWSWFESGDTILRVAADGEFSTKRNTKDRRIPVSPERVSRWRRALGNPTSGYIIPAPNKTARDETVERVANAWIKSMFAREKALDAGAPERKKKLHELRKMATSDFLRKTNGNVYLVARIIGDDPQTMLKYYAGVIKLDAIGL